jgi:hypothetical protein
MASLMGILMGAVSLMRIRASGGALVGRGMAWTAIIASAVLGVASSAMLERLSSRAEAEIGSQVRMATMQMFTDGPDPGAWWPADMASGAREFGARVRAELGPLKSLTTSSGERRWMGSGAEETLRLYMTFERGDMIGACRVAISADPRTWLPTVSMRSIELAGSASLGVPAAGYPAPEEDGLPLGSP